MPLEKRATKTKKLTKVILGIYLFTIHQENIQLMLYEKELHLEIGTSFRLQMQNDVFLFVSSLLRV